MTANLVEQFVAATQQPSTGGLLIVGRHDPQSSNTRWDSQTIDAPTVVSIPDSGGWSLRISPAVVAKVRAKIADFPHVETGGILMGRANDRLRTINVVDILPAPIDSVRSATGFVLGTEGGRAQILDVHERSGRTIYDVGTWHSHLAEEPPSPRDRATAKTVAGERPPPFALLIVTSADMHGIMDVDD